MTLGVRPRLAQVRVIGPGWIVETVCPGFTVSGVVDRLVQLGITGRVIEEGGTEVVEIPIADNREFVAFQIGETVIRRPT